VRVEEALSGIGRLFLDTPPVIYHVEGRAPYLLLTDIVFQAITDGRCEAVTSPVTLAECLVRPYQNGDLALVQQFRNLVTLGVNTFYVGIDVVAGEAAELRARYNLSLTDAFQVAAALAAGCDALLTNDAGLKRVNEIPVLVLDELEP
jgi:predicted nucleic acid-binding protein